MYVVLGKRFLKIPKRIIYIIAMATSMLSFVHNLPTAISMLYVKNVLKDTVRFNMNSVAKSSRNIEDMLFSNYIHSNVYSMLVSSKLYFVTRK